MSTSLITGRMDDIEEEGRYFEGGVEEGKEEESLLPFEYAKQKQVDEVIRRVHLLEEEMIRRINLLEGDVKSRLDRLEEENVIIEVSDNGTGIPEYAIKRAFEKFFSLKIFSKTLHSNPNFEDSISEKATLASNPT